MSDKLQSNINWIVLDTEIASIVSLDAITHTFVT